MAIFHLRAKVIQRSNGQSAVKSAAYRHGQRLYDERLGRAFAYKKPDVVHSAIIAPEGAPEWVFHRSELWNRAEMAETRSNAQIAREIEITLPRELARDQQVALVRGFISEHFVARGMVADIAIHVPLGADGLEQPHAHVMLTMRRLDGDTRSGFAKTKARDWNEQPEVEAVLREAKDELRKTERDGLGELVDALDKHRNIHIWRKGWADHVNSALAAANAAARVDHRTLKAQGIKREVEPYLGLARHIDNAYAFLKGRVANWLAVVKRNELHRAFKPYERRDATKFSMDVAAISAFTDGLMKHWNQRPRQQEIPNPEVGHEP